MNSKKDKQHMGKMNEINEGLQQDFGGGPRVPREADMTGTLLILRELITTYLRTHKITLEQYCEQSNLQAKTGFDKIR